MGGPLPHLISSSCVRLSYSWLPAMAMGTAKPMKPTSMMRATPPRSLNTKRLTTDYGSGYRATLPMIMLTSSPSSETASS